MKLIMLLLRVNVWQWFWAEGKFRQYLDGKEFTAVTDHAALQWLPSSRFTNSKLERWALAL